MFAFCRDINPYFAVDDLQHIKSCLEQNILQGINIEESVCHYLLFSTLGNNSEFCSFLQSVDGLFSKIDMKKLYDCAKYEPAKQIVSHMLTLYELPYKLEDTSYLM